MLSNDLQQIILLNPVRINYDLKKWNTEGKKDGSWSKDSLEFLSMSNGSQFGDTSQNVWDGVPFQVQREFRNPLWRSLANTYIRFRLLFSRPTKDPVKFFMEVKGNFKELENIELNDKQIEEMVTDLEKSKQRFAVSTLFAKNNLVKTENKLYHAGITQYQTEKTLVEFIKKCKKGLCLTEIEYFDRVIPPDVMEKFDQAESLELFDNYYILYHDPKKVDNKNYTKAPTKPKDPIMFGVIKGSDKLYFIADWIDELCNLTYKDILETGVDYKLKLQPEK